ncbi:gamma-glutamylcyclotransferase family protein [Streptomyces olivoreticuli]|uniref:gamma-glutamylcyclotransferase family protein n=1 Tax=Streptomyces olivoreticuli TaxID=68246 RepID=UPI000E232555|nr:gamma-glutamylcyclotransferase family protein [Streptomyces olivoreticuli]
MVDRELLPVFVYGTLRPGRGNHARLLRGRTVAEKPARMRGAALYEGPGYPYAVADPEGEILGEALWLPADRYDAVLASLDVLEGYEPGGSANHYVRVIRPVRLPDGDTVRAWVYLAEERLAARLRLRGRRVEGGNWPG